MGGGGGEIRSRVSTSGEGPQTGADQALLSRLVNRLMDGEQIPSYIYTERQVTQL